MAGTLENYKKAILDLGEAKGEEYHLDSLEKEVEAAFYANESPAIFARKHRDALLASPSAGPQLASAPPNPMGPASLEQPLRLMTLREKEREDLMNYSCRMKAWALAFWWNVIFLFIFLYLQHGVEMRVRQLCLEDGIDGTNYIQNRKHEFHGLFITAFVVGTVALPIVYLISGALLAAVIGWSINQSRP